MREGQRVDGALVALEGPLDLPRVETEQVNREPLFPPARGKAANGQLLAVDADGRGIESSFLARATRHVEGAQRLAGGHVPESHHLVSADADCLLAVGQEQNLVGHGGVAARLQGQEGAFLDRRQRRRRRRARVAGARILLVLGPPYRVAVRGPGLLVRRLGLFFVFGSFLVLLWGITRWPGARFAAAGKFERRLGRS